MRDGNSPSSKTSASDNELSSEPILASIGHKNKNKRLQNLKAFVSVSLFSDLYYINSKNTEND